MTIVHSIHAGGESTQYVKRACTRILTQPETRETPAHGITLATIAQRAQPAPRLCVLALPPSPAGFLMSAHLSRLRLFQRHLRSLVWVGVWVWDWIHSHTPPTALLARALLLLATLFSHTSPHKPRLVVSHRTWHSFVIGPAVINKHTTAPVQLGPIKHSTHTTHTEQIHHTSLSRISARCASGVLSVYHDGIAPSHAPAPENRRVVTTGCMLADDVIFRCRGEPRSPAHPFPTRRGAAVWRMISDVVTSLRPAAH